MDVPEIGTEVTVYSVNGSVVGTGNVVEVLEDSVVVHLDNRNLEYPLLVPKPFVSPVVY